MICLLLGPPGCGKGTQGRLLSQWLGIQSLSTGSLLRSSADEALSRHLAAGGFATDEMVNAIIRQRLEAEATPRLILDGYPRTLDQAVYFDALLNEMRLPAPLAIHLRVSTESLEERLVNRRQCQGCGRVFNVRVDPPRQVNRCDDCDMELAPRADDEAATVRRRLATYNQVTAPVVDHYRSCGHLLNFDGDQHPSDVFAQVRAALHMSAATRGWDPK